MIFAGLMILLALIVVYPLPSVFYHVQLTGEALSLASTPEIRSRLLSDQFNKNANRSEDSYKFYTRWFPFVFVAVIGMVGTMWYDVVAPDVAVSDGVKLFYAVMIAWYITKMFSFRPMPPWLWTWSQSLQTVKYEVNLELVTARLTEIADLIAVEEALPTDQQNAESLSEWTAELAFLIGQGDIFTDTLRSLASAKIQS